MGGETRQGRWLRPEFEMPMGRVRAILSEDLRTLADMGTGGLWDEAMGGLRRIVDGPAHLMRPQLTLLGVAGAGAALDAQACRFAAGVELFHIFLLVHDDIMDNGSLRRGEPTLHRLLRTASWSRSPTTGEHLAVLIGDLLHTRALGLLFEAAAGRPGGRAAVRILLDAACRAGCGQFLDLQGWEGPAAELSQEDFRKVLMDKGGHHSVAAPLAAGFRLGAPDADVSDLLSWGRHAGLAFQGLDDLQDVLTGLDTGKDSLKDLCEGRLSMVSFLLRRHAPSEAWDELAPTLGRGLVPPNVRARLHEMIAEHALVTRGLELVRAELDAAATIGAQVPEAGGLRAGLDNLRSRLCAYADRIEAAERA